LSSPDIFENGVDCHGEHAVFLSRLQMPLLSIYGYCTPIQAFVSGLLPPVTEQASAITACNEISFAEIEPVTIPVSGGSYSDLIVTAPNLYRSSKKVSLAQIEGQIRSKWRYEAI
jgi:hypothetical protein